MIGSDRPLMGSERPLKGSKPEGDEHKYACTDGKCPICTGHRPLWGCCPKGLDTKERETGQDFATLEIETGLGPFFFTSLRRAFCYIGDHYILLVVDY